MIQEWRRRRWLSRSASWASWAGLPGHALLPSTFSAALCHCKIYVHVAWCRVYYIVRCIAIYFLYQQLHLHSFQLCLPITCLAMRSSQMGVKFSPQQIFWFALQMVKIWSLLWTGLYSALCWIFPKHFVLGEKFYLLLFLEILILLYTSVIATSWIFKEPTTL